MAGDWIKMQVGLESSPEVIAMSIELDLSEIWVVGALFKLWCWADQHTEDGNAQGVTKNWIDRYIGIDGFTDALINVNWLLVTGKNLTIPNFDRHNGKPAKQRAKGTQRVKEHRKRNGKTVTHTTKPRNGTSVTNPLLEKRREEKSNNKSAEVPNNNLLFSELWEMWPEHRRMKKTATLPAFEAQLLAHSFETIKAAAVEYCRRENSRGEFCLSLYKFLADQRFLDNPEAFGPIASNGFNGKTPEQIEWHDERSATHLQLKDLINAGLGTTPRAEAMKSRITDLDNLLGGS